MTKDDFSDSISPAELNRIIERQLKLKSTLSSSGAKTLAQQILEQVAAKHASSSTNIIMPPSLEEIEELAQALIDENEDAGYAFISRLRQTGTSPEDIYLSYLAKAAGVLGKWWDEDRTSFAEVTIGASRIYGILRVLDESYISRSAGSSKRALFVTPIGETHRLGVKMAADLFRRKGWKIELLLGPSQEKVLERIKHSSHVIVGLSSAGPHSVTELAKLVLAIRIHYPNVFIIISGQVLDKTYEAIEAMNPDATAKDFHSALDILEAFWARSKGKQI